MNTSLTAPIVQLEYNTPTGPRCGRPITPILTAQGMEAMRKAYWHGEPWGVDGGRIVVLIEDPIGVVGVDK